MNSSAEENLSLSKQLTEISELLETSDGLVTEEIEKRFASLSEKIDRCALFRDYAESRIQFLEKQALLFKNAAESTKRLVKSFETYLKICVINSGAPLRGEQFEINIRKNPPALVLEDLTSIPEEYFELHSETILRKDVLKDHLKMGKEINGARLEQSTGLTIKPRKV